MNVCCSFVKFLVVLMNLAFWVSEGEKMKIYTHNEWKIISNLMSNILKIYILLCEIIQKGEHLLSRRCCKWPKKKLSVDSAACLWRKISEKAITRKWIVCDELMSEKCLNHHIQWALFCSEKSKMRGRMESLCVFLQCKNFPQHPLEHPNNWRSLGVRSENSGCAQCYDMTCCELSFSSFARKSHLSLKTIFIRYKRQSLSVRDAARLNGWNE